MVDSTESYYISNLRKVLSRFQRPWWVAGSDAVELHRGRIPHLDGLPTIGIDVRDQWHFREALDWPVLRSKVGCLVYELKSDVCALDTYPFIVSKPPPPPAPEIELRRLKDGSSMGLLKAPEFSFGTPLLKVEFAFLSAGAWRSFETPDITREPEAAFLNGFGVKYLAPELVHFPEGYPRDDAIYWYRQDVEQVESPIDEERLAWMSNAVDKALLQRNRRDEFSKWCPGASRSDYRMHHTNERFRSIQTQHAAKW